MSIPEDFWKSKIPAFHWNVFLSIVHKEKYRIVEEVLYFINPNYETKFNLRPRRLWRFLNIPYIRNFYTLRILHLKEFINMATSHLSLIIPVYNRPNEVEELLDTLHGRVKQTSKVVIVEDGSKETWPACSRSFQR